jgi:hypothetical protein
VSLDGYLADGVRFSHTYPTYWRVLGQTHLKNVLIVRVHDDKIYPHPGKTMLFPNSFYWHTSPDGLSGNWAQLFPTNSGKKGTTSMDFFSQRESMSIENQK